MEYLQLQTSRAKNRVWLILLLAVLTGAVTAVFPAGLLLGPALWAYAGARTKPAWIALPAGVYGLLVFLLYSAEAAFGLFACAAAAAIALYFMQTRKVSNTYTALTLAGLFLAGLYCAVCLPGILSGAGAFAQAQAAIDEMIALYRTSATQLSGVSEEYLAFIHSYLDAFSEAASSFIVAALCVGAGVLGLGNLLFFRLFCRKNAEIAISPMREFRLWTLPRSMMLGLFALLIGSFVLEWSGWTFADSMSSTVNVLVGMPLLLQGLCVADYFIARSAQNVRAKRAAIYTLVGILFAFLQTPLILLGCAEQIFKLRDRTQKLPPKTA